jgi:hypothetical protein
MSDVAQISCTACGKRSDLTPDYLAQYAGQTTTCECGAALPIPAAPGPAGAVAPVPLWYPAPPLADGLPTGVFRDGDHLVARIGVRLPRRCASCGQPLNHELRPVRIDIDRPDESGIRLGGAVGILDRASRSEPMVIRYGYCREHAPWISHHTARTAQRVGLLACVLLVFASAAMASDDAPTPGLIVLVTALLVGFTAFALPAWAARVKGVCVDRGHAWLTGFGPGYLVLFPPYQEVVEKELARTEEAASALERLTD